MSLFPAFYNNQDNDVISLPETSSAKWLENSSFPSSSSNVKDESVQKTKKRKKRIKGSEGRKLVKDVKNPKLDIQPIELSKLNYNIAQDELYSLDKNRDLLLLQLTQQCKSARPRYPPPSRLPKVVSFLLKRKKRKSNRYYTKNTCIKYDQNDETTSEELKKTVENLNKAVWKDPHDVDSWMRLVNFQDDYFKFQPIRYKTSGERDRAIIQQKLTILERAMSANIADSCLEKKWLELATDGCEYEEARSKLNSIIKKTGPKLLLCLGRIMLNQLSLARCTVPVVYKNYKEAMEAVQKNKNQMFSKIQDHETLELLLYACQFLEQCGLWEMCWMCVKLFATLNLGIEIKDTSLSEEAVLEEENSILKTSSGTPLWVLWGKLELVRQGHHFLPMRDSENYPQRVVESDEVVDLVYHIRPQSHLRFMLMIPLLAKVPFLPRTHCVLAEIMTQLQPWALDLVEWHLALCFNSSPMLQIDGTYLKRLLPLQRPPQYLLRMPGQQQFFEFVNKLFQTLLDHVVDRQRVVIGIWYLRFYRWLDRLTKLGLTQCSPSRPKTKSVFKDFLKLEENRDTLLFFVEYALWSYENGDEPGSIKIFETLIASNGSILEQTSVTHKSDLCALYRAYGEILLASNHREKAASLFQKMSGKTSKIAAIQTFRQIAADLPIMDSDPSLEDIILPNFAVDWSACYVWFLVLNSSKDLGVEYLESFIPKQPPYLREKLWEIKIILYQLFIDSLELNLKVIKTAIQEFPLNGLFSLLMADFVRRGGGLWWRNIPHMLHPPTSLGAVHLAVAVLGRNQEKGVEAQENRVKALLENLALKKARSSGIVHRLRLQFLHEVQDLEGLNSARVQALEECPWNKDLYSDCIQFCPVEITNLTDVLVEKELRIHLTPDELEAMRD